MVRFFMASNLNRAHAKRSCRRGWELGVFLAAMFVLQGPSRSLGDTTTTSAIKTPSTTVLFSEVHESIKKELSFGKRNLVDWAAELLEKEPKNLEEALTKLEIMARAGLDERASKVVPQLQPFYPNRKDSQTLESIQLLIEVLSMELQSFETVKVALEAFPEQLNAGATIIPSTLINYLRNQKGWGNTQVDEWLAKQQEQTAKNLEPDYLLYSYPGMPNYYYGPNDVWRLEHGSRPGTTWLSLRFQNRSSLAEKILFLDQWEQEARKNPADITKMLDYLFIYSKMASYKNRLRTDPAWVADVVEPKKSLEAYYLGKQLFASQKWEAAKKLLQKADELLENPPGSSKPASEKNPFFMNEDGQRQYQASIKDMLGKCDLNLPRNVRQPFANPRPQNIHRFPANRQVPNATPVPNKHPQKTRPGTESPKAPEKAPKAPEKAPKATSTTSTSSTALAVSMGVDEKQQRFLHQKLRPALAAKRVAQAQAAAVASKENAERTLLAEEEKSKDLPSYWLRRATFYASSPGPQMTEEEIKKAKHALEKGLELKEPEDPKDKAEYRQSRVSMIQVYTSLLVGTNRHQEATHMLLDTLQKNFDNLDLAREVVQNFQSNEFLPFLDADEPLLWRWLEKQNSWTFQEYNLLDLLAKRALADVDAITLFDSNEAPDVIYAFVDRVEKMTKNNDPTRINYCVKVLKGESPLGIDPNYERLVSLLKEKFEQKGLSDAQRIHLAQQLFHAHISATQAPEAEKLLVNPDYQLQNRNSYILLARAAAQKGNKDIAMRNWRRSANHALKDPQQIQLNQVFQQSGLGDEIKAYYRDVKKKIPEFVEP